MTPCIDLVSALSSSLYMAMTMDSSVRRGLVTVDLTEGDIVRATSRGEWRVWVNSHTRLYGRRG